MAFLGVLGETLSGEGARKAGKNVGKAQQAAAATFDPYRSIGQGALDKVAGFYGIGPMAGKQTPQQMLESMPTYQAGLDAATSALARGASASGRLGSGGFGVDLAKLGLQYGSSIFNQEMNRLQGLGQMGMQANEEAANLRVGGVQSINQGRLAQQSGIMKMLGTGAMAAGMGMGGGLGGIASWFNPTATPVGAPGVGMGVLQSGFMPAVGTYGGTNIGGFSLDSLPMMMGA